MFTDLTNFAPSSDRVLYSGGYVCQHLNINPAQLRVLMEDTGVKFTMIVDGVAYFDGDGANTVIEKCNAVRSEIKTAQDAVASN